MGMFGASGKSAKVNLPKGKSLPGNKVTFSTAKKGAAGSGAERNARMASKYGKKK